MLLLLNFQPGGPEKLARTDDPRHTLQEPYLVALTQLTLKLGHKEIDNKTEVIFYVSDLDNAPSNWKISEVRALTTVATAAHGNIALGVAVGPRRCIAEQLLSKADVIRAMHEGVQICQTEFAFIRESPHMNKINHIFRVHGHKILTEETAAKTFDEVGQVSLASSL